MHDCTHRQRNTTDFFACPAGNLVWFSQHQAVSDGFASPLCWRIEQPLFSVIDEVDLGMSAAVKGWVDRQQLRRSIKHESGPGMEYALEFDVGAGVDRDSIDELVPYSKSGAIHRSQSTPATEFARVEGRSRFINDLIVLGESPLPLERYKAFWRILNWLDFKWQSYSIETNWRLPEVWSQHEALELLQHVIKVGEGLAKFGTADFAAGNNSSRAITVKDYARLLQEFLQRYGGLFQPEVLGHVSYFDIQTEAIAVRNLLAVRCDACQLIYSQLIKHTGLEPGAGSAVVTNNSVVTANPTVAANATPNINVETKSQSLSTIKHPPSRAVTVALVGAGLWLLRKYFRKISNRGGDWDSDDWSRKGRSKGNNQGSMNAKLVVDKERMERLAIQHLSWCNSQLQKSEKNSTLLEKDWRLGGLRLASPGSTHPPGYERIDASQCNLDAFLGRLQQESRLEKALSG